MEDSEINNNDDFHKLDFLNKLILKCILFLLVLLRC